MSYFGNLNKQWSVDNPPINRKDKPTERPMAAAEAGTDEEPEVLEAVEVGRKSFLCCFSAQFYFFRSLLLFWAIDFTNPAL